MRLWYIERDLLGFATEDVIPASMTQVEMVDHVMAALVAADVAR